MQNDLSRDIPTPPHRAVAADPVDDGDDHPERNEVIGVGGGDENVAKLQLAARWAEKFAEPNDTLEAALKRFQRVYNYVDSVTKLVDPDQI